jgi:putative DNA methylase
MATKKERITQEVARAVGAGKAVAMETVDFSDPNRPKTCLEVDFPILPINYVAALEATTGATKKPVYQLMKWWARRQPSVFRSLLIAAATKSPDDPFHAAKHVWSNYYANHQKSGNYKGIKVADIFMGGGTTVFESSRLGMSVFGNDLNPVAWFVAKQTLAEVDPEQVRRLASEIEEWVKPQIMPFYTCDGANGEKGVWIEKASKKKMGLDFDPLSITPNDRHNYQYQGPEIIYTIWDKHGPCQVTGCNHRTPIITNPIMAVKSITVKAWSHKCTSCSGVFDVEKDEGRMSPESPLYVSGDEPPFSILDPKRGAICPHCGFSSLVRLGKGKNKKIELSLLIHPQWLLGSPEHDAEGTHFGGSAQDDARSTSFWNCERAKNMKILEVRGRVPEKVVCPETGVEIHTGKEHGTVPKRAKFTCASCGTVQDLLAAVKQTGKTGPVAGYLVQALDPNRKQDGAPYRGRYFKTFGSSAAKQYSAAVAEWEDRKDSDLKGYWPESEVPFGFMTTLQQGGVHNHGYTHWWMMFNPRQLLVHSSILKAICTLGEFDKNTREYLLAAFQQYLRNQCMFTIWDYGADQLTPMLSNNNFHPKTTAVENCVFADLGRGNWRSCVDSLFDSLDYNLDSWDNASNEYLKHNEMKLSDSPLMGKTSKIFTGEEPVKEAVTLRNISSTDLGCISDSEIDLIITDPPFGGLLHYSELSDFFYVWMRLFLKDIYPETFGAAYTPKAMEAVSNRAREPEDPDGFYQQLLTACWSEAHRILKPGGILAFTFHHSEDAPWVSVLESLFDAGFYLEATYPIRSDETKGEGSKPGTFGSQQIEYDIVHVCRKRTEEPKEVSWGRMRREVLADVRQLQGLLENHARAGLPAADLQVIRRGKALEYFSRHYGKVYVDEGRPISVKDALVGINQLIDEDANKTAEPVPVIAEPITRQFLRTFDGKTELARDQMQKLLRGSGIAPDEFVNRGWCGEEKKVFQVADPLDFARDWQGKHRRRLTADLDQALVIIGACYDGSGINASDTLKNENFKPHPALKSLLEWISKRGQTQTMRNASSRALTIYNNWAASNKDQVRQLSLFQED